jgi:hypothetical protein
VSVVGFLSASALSKLGEWQTFLERVGEGVDVAGDIIRTVAVTPTFNSVAC